MVSLNTTTGFWDRLLPHPGKQIK